MFQEDNTQGPPMIVATSILRPPRTRVGKIYGNLRLPRSVELRSVGATLAGAFVGLLVWTFAIGIVFGYNFESFLYTVIVFGGLGLSTLYIQPMKGEPLWRWMLFKAQEIRGGGAEKLHICTKRLDREALGSVTIVPACVDVAAGSFDERGAIRKRVETGREVDPAALAGQGFAAPKSLAG